ncbi:MAG TPA: TonB family protein [Gammaproteobacteria bacterium]|nr:TonB family protein [Gammaproteobacteria bacterium]
MSTAIYYHSPDLPWTVSREDSERFQRTLVTIAVIVLTLSIAVPYLPVFKQEKPLEMEVPERYARLIMERKAPPPPPPPPPKQIEKPQPKPEPQVKKEVKPKKQPKVAKQKPRPETQKRAAAREKAARSGLLAFSSEIASLQENAAVASIKKTQTVASAGRKARTERAILTSNVARGSKGIETAHLSRDTGTTQLATRQTTRVEQALVDDLQRPPARKRDGGLPLRSDESIQLVFDRNKGKLYSLYNRALRKDSTLKGKVVLRLTILPSGRVSAIEIVSSDLAAPRLERKLKARIRMFDFGPAEVAETTITYPIDFFPV